MNKKSKEVEEIIRTEKGYTGKERYQDLNFAFLTLHHCKYCRERSNVLFDGLCEDCFNKHLIGKF